jgi:hypothetical protein
MSAVAWSEGREPRDRKNGNQMAAVFVVGDTRLELVTSTMSTWRSNQLS